MMRKLEPTETDLVGNWLVDDDGVRGDATTERIRWLTSGVLEEVARSPESGAWETLFRDPDDGRFWEQTYPRGEMHGGGPPRLINISFEAARTKYALKRT